MSSNVDLHVQHQGYPTWLSPGTDMVLWVRMVLTGGLEYRGRLFHAAAPPQFIYGLSPFYNDHSDFYLRWLI